MLSMADINRVTLDHVLRDEEAAGQVLFAAAQADDAEIFKTMVKECQTRGIDVGKVVTRELNRPNPFMVTR